MKNNKNVLACLLLSSLVSVVAYLLGGLLIGIFLSGVVSGIKTVFNIAVGILTCTVNVYVYIRMRYISDGSGKRQVLSDYPDKYPGLICDIIKILKEERFLFISLFSVAVISWALGCLDLVFFKKRFFSMPISLLFISIHFFVPLLPFSEKNILGYLIGVVIFCIIYIIGLALARKTWYGQKLYNAADENKKV